MKLQFTNGYYPDFSKISRILKFLSSQENKSKVLHKEIVSALGIPYRQVRSIISVMVGFGLVKTRGNILTFLGEKVAQFDPYFQNHETLWLIHYIVSSNPNLIVWNRVVTRVLQEHTEISLPFVIEEYFGDIKSSYSEQTYKDKLPREIRSVLDSYSASELSNLDILKSHEADHYYRTAPTEIPDFVFLFSLVYFRDHFSPGATAINIENLSNDKNSPGSVFFLEAYQVRNKLNILQNRNLIRVEQFGNLDQVRYSESSTQESILEKIFGEENAS